MEKWDTKTERRVKMARKREYVNICLDRELHMKLVLISFGQKYGLGDKKASMSNIVNAAVYEYLENHSEEMEKALDEFRKRGGVIPT